MKFRPINKFQEGGEIPEEQIPVEEAPAEKQGTVPAGQSGEDPLMQVAQIAAQALQNKDCNAAMQVCQIFLQMVQQMGQQNAPEQPKGEPVFRKGGILVRRK